MAAAGTEAVIGLSQAKQTPIHPPRPRSCMGWGCEIGHARNFSPLSNNPTFSLDNAFMFIAWYLFFSGIWGLCG